MLVRVQLPITAADVLYSLCAESPVGTINAVCNSRWNPGARLQVGVYLVIALETAAERTGHRPERLRRRLRQSARAWGW